jgi:hypothetical protein
MFVWNCLTPQVQSQPAASYPGGLELDPDIAELGELLDYDDSGFVNNTLLEDMATLARDSVLILNDDAKLSPVFRGTSNPDDEADETDDEERDERQLEEKGDDHAKNFRFGHAARSYWKAAERHAQIEQEARQRRDGRLSQWHREAGKRVLSKARKYAALGHGSDWGMPSFESFYQSSADTGTVPAMDELGPGTGYVGNALMPVPPVITANSNVRAGVRYDLQEEIASAMDDAMLPLPKPVW